MDMYSVLMWITIIWSGMSGYVSSEECAQYIDECPCMNRTINCSGQHITTLPGFLLYTGSYNIDTLLVNENQISRLPKDAFKGLSVKVINMSNNPIRHISDKAFTEMSSVLELIMDNCGLTSVSSGFNLLSSLRKLSLRDNHISQLPTVVFQQLITLIELDLSGNTVQFVSPFDAFAKLTNLEILDLSRNEMHSISNEVLHSLTALQILHLEENHINMLPGDIFQNNVNLSAVYLLNNNLVFTGEITVFQGLYKLETLHISHCNISNLDTNMFVNKSRLRNLSLSHCLVAKTKSGAFDGIINQLHALDISGSGKLWNDLKQTLKKARHLKQLRLVSLNLTDIPTEIFKNLNKLILLDLQNNSIRQLKAGAFNGMQGLNGKIHLENNQISSVSQFLFTGMSPPLSLYLNNNQLTSIAFIDENPCSFDRSLIDLTGNEIKCDCTTAKITQRKLVHLIGTCNATVSDQYDGLSLAPLNGSVPVGEGYLEEKAALVCELESRLDEKYDCCSSDWVSVGTPSLCPVYTGGSDTVFRLSIHTILMIFVTWLLVVLK